jgi:hypothetical protein
MPVLLLALLALALAGGAGMVVLVRRLAQRPLRFPQPPRFNLEATPSILLELPSFSENRPACWLAVRSVNLAAVQAALDLHDPRPCSWVEGFTTRAGLFIAPPVNGWILVAGAGVPDPSDDVDACYRFVRELSRRLGEVHLFCANGILCHHAWVRAEGGRVLRAYAWAGRTLWHQGRRTPAEDALGLQCFDYGDPVPNDSFGLPEAAISNVDKVPLLAARWSLDPARIDQRIVAQAQGVVGAASRIC